MPDKTWASDPFETELAAMFASAPADDVDPAAFVAAIEAQLAERAKVRRLLIGGAGLTGIAIAAATFAASGGTDGLATFGVQTIQGLSAAVDGGGVWLWAGLAAALLSLLPTMQQSAI